MLTLRDVDVSIQASEILRRVSLEVGEREVVCLVGRNGAGKTTTLRAIMGYLRLRAGTIEFLGRNLAGLPTHQIANLGIGYARRERDLSRLDRWGERRDLDLDSPGRRPAPERVDLAYATFPVLRTYARRKGTQMSGGERKMLSIARALALDPRMLLLDEPFEGLSPAIIPAVSRGIATITEAGHAILMAESNIHHVPEIATRLYVIERGEIIFAGRPADVRRDPAVLRIIGG